MSEPDKPESDEVVDVPWARIRAGEWRPATVLEDRVKDLEQAFAQLDERLNALQGTFDRLGRAVK